MLWTCAESLSPGIKHQSIKLDSENIKLISELVSEYCIFIFDRKGMRMCLSLMFTQGHYVASVHWSLVGGRKRQSAAGWSSGHRVLGVQVTALTCADCESKARGCGGAAPRAQTST